MVTKKKVKYHSRRIKRTRSSRKPRSSKNSRQSRKRRSGRRSKKPRSGKSSRRSRKSMYNTQPKIHEHSKVRLASRKIINLSKINKQKLSTSVIVEKQLKTISHAINETQKEVVTQIVKSKKVIKLKNYVNLVMATNKLKIKSRKISKKDDGILVKISVLTKKLNEIIFHSYVEFYSEYENIFTSIFGKTKKITILARLILFIIIISATYTYIPVFLQGIRIILKMIDQLIGFLLMIIPGQQYNTSSSDKISSTDIVVFSQDKNNTVALVNRHVTSIMVYASKGTGTGMVMATKAVIDLITALSEEGPEAAAGGMVIITITLLKAFKTMYRFI